MKKSNQIYILIVTISYQGCCRAIQRELAYSDNINSLRDYIYKDAIDLQVKGATHDYTVYSATLDTKTGVHLKDEVVYNYRTPIIPDTLDKFIEDFNNKDRDMQYTSGKNVHNINTGLIGEISTTYRKLVMLFGEPTFVDCEKVDVEWKIKFRDGKIATIYNWKDGKNYRGENGLDVENITDWHIGGVVNVADRLNNDITDEKLVVNRITGIVKAG